MARKIVITSGKGGVGKTTVAAHLGGALAKSGARVCMVDADVGLNNLDVALNMEGDIVYDIGDIIAGRCSINKALICDKVYNNLYLLPTARYLPIDVLTNEIFSDIITELQPSYDFILIDCPAGIDEGFQRAVVPASEAIVVTTPHISALRDADKVIGMLGSYHIATVGLAVNRVRGDMVVRGKMMSPYECSQLLRVQIRGVLPEDDIIVESNHISANIKSKTAEAYTYFAENIRGMSQKIYNPEAQYSGIFGRFKRR
ncbi:MAG: septum site-determining protein MinD [Bacillota bacterium]